MRQVMIYLSLGVLLVVAGCARAFQPPPAFELWTKSGASKLDVGKALMECGMPDTSGFIGYNELSTNDKATIDFCMERAGYREKGGGKASDWCANHREKNLPACQSGAKIPTPSVQKRLNSQMCTNKFYRDGLVCQL